MLTNVDFKTTRPISKFGIIPELYIGLRTVPNDSGTNVEGLLIVVQVWDWQNLVKMMGRSERWERWWASVMGREAVRIRTNKTTNKKGGGRRRRRLIKTKTTRQGSSNNKRLEWIKEDSAIVKARYVYPCRPFLCLYMDATCGWCLHYIKAPRNGGNLPISTDEQTIRMFLDNFWIKMINY